MHQLLLATVLLSATSDVPDGSLLVLENNNKPVTRYTRSTITHIAIVLNRDAIPWVYEATPAKVRRIRLSEYYAEIGRLDAGRKDKTRTWLLQPKTPYSSDEIAKMTNYVESQLGRRYSVKSYVRERQGDGIHCAEFASSALSETDRFEFNDRHYATSPGKLYLLVKHQHGAPARITTRAPQVEQSWCSEAWQRWFSFRQWCNWACYETWTFYR